ncbi:hypothetical protein [Spongiactinospora sp. 9N601]|uniref:hypothetical protein n=1 Tax=Spongiactinospora sp. 9N601 TaxID=3375149 RepID=UPI00379CBCEC
MTFVVLGAVALIQQMPRSSASGDWAAIGIVIYIPMIVFSALVTRMRRLTAAAREQQQEAEADPRERLHRRIAAINTTFADAATLMNELRRDLEAQQAVRDALVAETEEHREVLAIEPERAQRIRQILVGETKATIRAERRQQWIFFALGVAISVPIGVLINLFVP